jgi:leucyl-tRNA synthetase
LLNEIEAVKNTIGSSKGQNLITINDSLLLIKLIAPLAPFIAEELFQALHLAQGVTEPSSIHLTEWPTWNEQLAAESTLIIPVQVNGKVRSQLEVEAHLSQDKNQVLALAKNDAKVQPWLAAGTISKEIYVPGKIVNFVVI